MSSEIAIRATNLQKSYQIYATPRDRLKQFLLPRAQRLLGLRERRYFSEFKALGGLDFEIRRGETFGIVGRNGSGKSTLLQILCGTLSPTAGAVEVNGRVAALLELGAGFNPEFTGRENVFMNARVLGLTQEQIEDRFDAIAAFADIDEFIDRPVKTYSSGMFVRLAFSVVAHVDADILVIDEALSVGDAYFVQKCMRFLREFMNRGTLLFVSHDTGAVLNLCSKAIFLEHGTIRAEGTPKTVVRRYLEDLVESNQGALTIASETVSAAALDDLRGDASGPIDVRDVRLDLFNQSNFRNDLQVFAFDAASASFGTGAATIRDVQLVDAKTGLSLAWTVGGELVQLRVRADAREDLSMPIVGFQLMDRLGQTLFGDNTYLLYQNQQNKARAGQEVQATFEFRMPILPTGDYSFCVAIADGTQSSHVQHHWLHEALVIRAHATSAHLGLVGIPMSRIELRTE